MAFDERIKTVDKISILSRTGVKAIRGIWAKLFFKKAHGLLLIGSHVAITHAKHISCGRNVKFEDYAEIHGLCSHGIHLGDNVTIGRFVMIRPSSYYGGDLGHGLTMGNNSSIGPHGYVGCSGPIVIGNNVMVGPKCSMFAENHVFSDSGKTIKSQGVVQKGISIGDDCWIGSNVIILDGVHIGNHVVIGAGTLVTKDVPDNTIIMDKRKRLTRPLIQRTEE